MKKSHNISNILLIQIVTGIYFAISGLLGVMGFYSGSNQFFDDIYKLIGRNNYMPLIISIVFMLAGLVLISDVFLNMKNRIVYYVILILWITFVIMSSFTDNFLKPDTLLWAKELALNSIILTSLWASSQR
ncbi:MAG: hypothetical protein B6229_03000 [Spirochaetaceae bacterium 4572_7]|nr:MAG: hypothetical protein B6229_03000 [Spirochaetaceae bacterium 4572_7]